MPLSPASSHGTTPRRGSLAKEGFPGLWWRVRSDGEFVYEIKLRQDDGVLRSNTLPDGTSEKQAKTAWKKASSQRDEGGRPLSQNLSLSRLAVEAFGGLEAQVQAGTRSQRTLDAYRNSWTKYVEPSLGRRKVSKIGSREVLLLVAQLRQWQRDDGQVGLAEWSASGVITCLRWLLRFGRHSGVMAHDPFSMLSPDDLPQQRARESFEARVLRPSEIERLIAATTPTYTNAVTVLAFSGLRVSELAGLTWMEVDLVDRVIQVREQLAPLKRGEDPKRVKTKSKPSVREVPLLDRAYEALVAQLAVEQAKGLGADTDFVFTSMTGRPLGRHRLSKRGVANAARKAGLGHVTAQVLRRSVATATAHARVPVVIAAAMTGHSPQVYDTHYAKPFRDAEERAKVRESLASIGFGNAAVDQTIDQTL
jgi:integrase